MDEKTTEKPAENYRHIVRVANVDLPGEKRLSFALTKIKGIGIIFAEAICSLSKVSRNTKTGYLTPDEVKKLNEVIANPVDKGMPSWMFNRRKDFETGEDKHLTMGTLAFVHDNDLKRLKKINIILAAYCRSFTPFTTGKRTSR